ncbi:MAG: carbohydrate kinase [Lactobacillaceae bacterium]|jgi:L-xylulokinase|nr:carbohydrate kinase [Lactobacillaceae bacterium]
MTHYFLTIDNGGTNTKAVVFDVTGKQLSTSAFPTPRIEEHPSWREINLDVLWESIVKAINDAITKADIKPSDISAIAVVGHGKGLYPLNKHQQIFRNGILSTDARADLLGAEFESKVSQIWPISQQHVMSVQSPVLLRWLKDNRRLDYDQIGAILSAKDFVRYKLSGVVNQEIGDASGNGLLNLATKNYDDKLLEFFGIPEIKDALPELVESTQIAAKTNQETFELTGINLDTPIVGGLFDIHAGALATGVVDSSKFSVIAGTWNINSYPDKTPATQDEGLMNSLLFNGQYLIEASSATSAGNLDIMISQLMDDEKQRAKEAGKSIYEDLEDFLQHTDASFVKALFLPFLYGSNAGVGARAAFVGLDTQSSKSEMIRAVYEGIAFAHRQHIEQLLAHAENRPEVLRLSGGAVNSPSWMQIFANVTNIPVEVVDATELGGLGGMMAASVAIGDYQDLNQAVEKLVTVKSRFEPDEKQVRLYDQKYTAYQNLISALQPVWKAISLAGLGDEN